jgi:hypothetical protein
MTNYPTTPNPSRPEISPRRVALIAGVGLLIMAVLAPFALFGVIQSLVVPADAAATVQNIVASEGLFRAGIAAFLIVIMLDVLVAWALYVLLRPVNNTLALLTAWLRLVFAAVFGYALVNLLDVAQLVGAAQQSSLQGEQLQAQVTASLASFNNGWTGIAMAIFGLHLFGLGYLLIRSAHFPWFLGVLVAVAGGGYLVDSFGMILVPDYAWTIGTFTFIGEALLILWLFWRAIRGFPSESESLGGLTEPRLAQPTPATS